MGDLHIESEVCHGLQRAY